MPRTKLTAAQLSEKQKQLADLKRIRYAGVSQTSHQGKTVVFKSDADLNKAIDDLENEINGRLRVRRVLVCPKLA